jgi:hypothetical protein
VLEVGQVCHPCGSGVMVWSRRDLAHFCSRPEVMVEGGWGDFRSDSRWGCS